jgi:D-glycero-D-manno-heptose 1,7-bisphosphate phosphatase
MKNKALFLDRDGVINVDKNYVYRVEDFEFIDGIFDVLRFFQERGYLLIIITNQAGIGRGYYTEEDFHRLNTWMLGVFKDKGIIINKVYYCPYHKEHGIGQYKRDSYDRKPNPGMILKAVKDFNIDLSKSILIGDKESDIEAGINAGIPKNILINNEDNVSSRASYIVKNIIYVPELILNS